MRNLFLNPLLLAFVAAALITTGCTDSERLSRLEKQNQELQDRTKTQQAAVSYDLSQKCSQEARSWYIASWPVDKATIMQTHSNHYNKAQNKCFVLVELHSKSYEGGQSWDNDMTLWDVQENSRYGEFTEHHAIMPALNFQDNANVLTCELLGTKCKGLDEWNRLASPYMNN